MRVVDDGQPVEPLLPVYTLTDMEDALDSVASDQDCEEETGAQNLVDVLMVMLSTDQLFGFSVVGGVDEGLPPQIDEVHSGSPADRADLEVGDEIMEVNGHTLEGATHAEVIAHIHKCIKSRTIQLRVKRSSSDDLVPGLNDIQDAYVIAVEEQARARLEQLSSMHKVQPVDITRLSQLANFDLGAEGDKSARIYVTANNNIGSTAALGNCQELGSGEVCVDGDVDTCSENSDDSEDQLLVEETCIEALENNMETAVMNGYVNGHSNGPLPQDPRYISVNMSVGNKIEDQDNSMRYPSPPNYEMAVQGMHHSKEHVYEDVDLSADESEINDSGPHREMAIDCPANFVGSKKERPSYPPPPNARNSPRSTPIGTPIKHVEGGSQRSFAEPVPQVMAEPPQMTKEEQIEYIERKKKYQEDLQKRREQEEKIAREQEFLRNSLRGSEKLKSLQELRADSRPAPAGIVNPNYLVEEDEVERDSSAPTSRASTLPLRARVEVVDGSAPRLLGADDLLNSLGRVQSSAPSLEDKKEVASVSRLFQNPRFQQTLAVYNKVVEVSMRRPQPGPVCDNGQELCGEVLGAMPAQPPHPYMEELSRLLRGPNMKALLLAHDKVAQQKSAPATTATDDDEREYLYERASQYNEDSIKIVRLQKTADPLGATVRNEGDSVIVGRIVKGGAAEKSGLLHEGDEILEINGIDIRGKSVNDVCDLMANMTGTLTFLIVPTEEFSQPLEPTTPTSIMMHVKAHFNYDPEDDLYIPCRELGISFLKGDILHVINQEDPNWWQAYREGEDDQTLAGLVPSKTFQEHREAMKQTIVGDSKENPKKKSKCRCRKHNKKKKKQLYNAASEELDAEEILTYEEVALYYPQPNRKRPIVLIGPPNVGRHELRQKLMESDLERFAAAIPHTSRPRKGDEIDGKDYHFVPRHVFEADITGHKFVEYGEFEKNLYGTSLDAIRQVVNAGKICVLNLYPQSLRILKASDLKPYVVFVAPPNLEKLKQIRRKQFTKATTDDELKDIIEKAREMEENYGHYFDLIITNYDLDRAYEELVAEINRLEVEPQWVPSQWVT